MAHPDLDELVNVLLPFAQDMLRKRRGFLPFGAKLDMAGAVTRIAGYTGVEQPKPSAIIELLQRGLRLDAMEGKIRAAGICYAVEIRKDSSAAQPQDAILAHLEHSETDPVDVYLPYRLRWLRRPSYGQLSATPTERRFFVGDTNTGPGR